MPRPITATEMRASIYRVIDRVLETGEPQEVVRNGRAVLVVPKGRLRRDLRALPKREALCCTPDELVETTWEDAWRPDEG